MGENSKIDDLRTVAMRFGVDCAVDVSELPDRTSPDDRPEMMLVTASELSAIVERRFLDLVEKGFPTTSAGSP